jgi:hypothetical protein
MNARSLTELGRMADKLQLMLEKPKLLSKHIRPTCRLYDRPPGARRQLIGRGRDVILLGAL